jgi:hypothetical protein
MHVPRRCLILGPLLFAALSLPVPARATVLPSGTLTVTTVTGGFKACATGSADPTLNLLREWDFRAVGVDSTGALILPPSQFGTGLTFTSSPCITILKGSASAGAFSVTLTYGGAGLDAVLVLAGSGTWSATTGDHVTGMTRP